MGGWIRIAGGQFKNKASRGWSGYVKLRNDTTIKSPKVKEQNAKLRNAAIECKGRSRAEFLACMSEKL